MKKNKENQIQTVGKEELRIKNQELTHEAKWYIPRADIFEGKAELYLKLDMPGVRREGVDVHLEKDELSIRGRIKPDQYDDYQPLYSEFNVGHFARTFHISNEYDQGKIKAEMGDGVLSITIPKREETLPRKILIS